jgi:GntR family transcriptional repressor for pyruvate dehydrogenase complex
MRPDPPVERIRPLERSPHMAQQVAEHLSRLIATGALAAGEKLPGEVALAQRLGVSRPTLREALRILKGRGLLSIRPRSGTYVAAPPERGRDLAGRLPGAAHLWDVLELRRILDPECAALAARRRTPGDLSRLRELMREGADLAGPELVTWRDGARVYGRFFFLLAQATHNTLVTQLTEALAGMLRDALAYSRLQLARRPEAGEVIRGHFREILAAVEAGDHEAARGATARHLAVVEEVLRELESAP